VAAGPLPSLVSLCFAGAMTPTGALTPMEAAERLAALSPQTRNKLRQWKAQWAFADDTAYGAFRAVGAAIASKRSHPDASEMNALFAFSESLLNHGSGDVEDMVASMLREIWAAARESGFDFAIVDPHLGPEARNYLLAWDRFHKAVTPGLTGK
jgi:hypothetical protein